MIYLLSYLALVALILIFLRGGTGGNTPRPLSIILLLAASTLCLGAYVPPRPQPVARALQPVHVARIVEEHGADRVTLAVARNLEWRANIAWQRGDIATYLGAIYICITAHTSQYNWAPPDVPALWYLYRAAGEAPQDYPAWRQPLGAHDAYQAGDRVKYGGKVYESLINNNVWSPDAYPAGWKEIPTP